MPETVLVRFTELAHDRLKIPYRAGYEHFVPEDHVPGKHRGVPEDGAVFVWCDRTKFAE